MRKRLIFVVAAVAACASSAPPPGGPEDKAPPQLVRVTPDTNAVSVSDKYASFYFDETINDRGTGAQDLANYFLVSPSDGGIKLNWHRSRIDVAPKRGFRNGVAYTITLLPGLTDLRNNPMKTGSKVIFSTGPTIPPYFIRGIVFDWVAERPAPLAYIEAVTPDSVVYLAQADSTGHFEVGPVTQGTYMVRGIIDANSNRALDRNEAFDSVRVAVPTPNVIELLAASRDTLAARILTVSVADSLTLRVAFDRAVDPTQTMSVQSFHLAGPDSVAIPLAAVLTPAQERVADSLARKVTADSLRRADSLAGKPLMPIPSPAQPVVGGRPTPVPPPKPSRPSPYTSVVIKLGQQLRPATEYRLAARAIKSLAGRTDDSDRRFTTPKPPPPKPAADTTAAKAPPAATRPPR